MRERLSQRLKDHARNRSHSTVALLAAHQHRGFRSFWICNCLAVYNPSPALEAELRQLHGGNVRKERVVQIPEAEMAAQDLRARKAEVEWNIKIGAADKLWEQTGIKGQRVVVATIDTGVRYTHEAMRDGYRAGGHSWYDAEGTDPPRFPNGPSETPFDNNGHGTHVAGSLSGTHGIGVAPGAEWITCKGFDSSGRGAERHLLACGEFVACPTRWDGSGENCALAPHVVSNSWGFGCGGCTGEGDPLQRMTEVWRAMGIFAAFAAGNSGPSCGSATSPGDLGDVLSVGGTDFHDNIAAWSSKGPPVDPAWPYGRQKPEITAPGGGVRSAGHQTDTAYTAMSGSSMATPQAAGAVALLISALGGGAPPPPRAAPRAAPWATTPPPGGALYQCVFNRCSLNGLVGVPLEECEATCGVASKEHEGDGSRPAVASRIEMEALTKLLVDGADQATLSADRSCGGVPDSEFPNYSYGYGRLNACRPVQLALRRGSAKAVAGFLEAPMDCESPGPPGQDDCYCTDTCESGCNAVGLNCCCGAWNQCFCSDTPGCCPMNAGMPCEEWRGGNVSVPTGPLTIHISTWDQR